MGRGEEPAVAPSTDQDQLVYRVNPDELVPPLVTEVLEEAGWRQWDPAQHHPDDWNLWWKVGKFRYPEPSQLLPWQRLNHYPKSTCLAKKDHLCRALRVCREVYGRGIFNFWPHSFNLPSEYQKFVSEYDTRCEQQPSKEQYWIVKPAELSRGRGIYVFTDVSELQYSAACIVQAYIERPLLIAGYKFDLRLYVCVTSFHPLTIYAHNQGLVRFSTDQYDLSSLNNPYSHLTNTSINKHNPHFLQHIEGGTKWTLAQLRQHLLHTLRVDDRWLWQRVAAIIILTFISQLGDIPPARNCFELYGVDILIDDNLKPWLLEVNYGPQLVCDTITDLKVKKAMIGDLLKLCHFTASDTERGNLGSGSRLRARLPWRYRGALAPPSRSGSHSRPATSSASQPHPRTAPQPPLHDYGKRYYEQRQLARKKKYLDQWQNIENVYPMASPPTAGKSAASGRRTITGDGKAHRDGAVSDGDGAADDEEGTATVSGKQHRGILPAPPHIANGGNNKQADSSGGGGSARYESHPCFNLPSLAQAGAASNTAVSPTPITRETGLAAGSGQDLVVTASAGGFQLIFPFNNATHLQASTSEEVRRSVGEVRSMLRSTRQEVNRWPLGSGQGSQGPVEYMLLWRPLIP